MNTTNTKKFQNIAFITGPARSGTTLLLRMMAGGENHKNFPECGPLTAILDAFTKQLSTDETRLKAFYGDPHGRIAIYKNFIDQLISQLLREEQHRNWLFLKDPYLIRKLHAVESIIPEATVIFTLRNPINILMSRQEVAQRKNIIFDIKENSKSVNNDIKRTVMEFNKRKSQNLPHEKTVILRYEDLVSRPKDICTSLSKILKTELTPTLAPNIEKQNNPFRTNLWTSKVPVPQTKDISKVFDQKQLRSAEEEMHEAAELWSKVKTILD